jgi:hypothetical protein
MSHFPFLILLSWAFGAGFAFAQKAAEAAFQTFDETGLAQGAELSMVSRMALT